MRWFRFWRPRPRVLGHPVWSGDCQLWKPYHGPRKLNNLDAPSENQAVTIFQDILLSSLEKKLSVKDEPPILELRDPLASGEEKKRKKKQYGEVRQYVL